MTAGQRAGLHPVSSDAGHEELKARRDYALGWITPFMGIIGVIAGALLGYFLGARR
jgi:hypothetical protein